MWDALIDSFFRGTLHSVCTLKMCVQPHQCVQVEDSGQNKQYTKYVGVVGIVLVISTYDSYDLRTGVPLLTLGFPLKSPIFFGHFFESKDLRFSRRGRLGDPWWPGGAASAQRS